MGYYTRYSLSIVGQEDEDISAHKEAITKISEYDEAPYLLLQTEEDWDNLFDDKIKWYDSDGDMQEYSKRHPELVFKLSGEGEESGDVWVRYFHNGKMQKSQAKIVTEDYDPTKLQ